jgi:hypothetical protein
MYWSTGGGAGFGDYENELHRFSRGRQVLFA